MSLRGDTVIDFFSSVTQFLQWRVWRLPRAVAPPTLTDRKKRACIHNVWPNKPTLCFLIDPGATHSQLIAGAEAASDGKVAGRFFHLHPRRQVELVPWLASWIKKGAVPVATMNMQVAVPEGEEVPDAWHHQLVFGVAPNAVFMTNPLDVGEWWEDRDAQRSDVDAFLFHVWFVSRKRGRGAPETLQRVGAADSSRGRPAEVDPRLLSVQPLGQPGRRTVEGPGCGR